MILIAARSNSARFPKKHLAPLGDSTVLDVLISRVEEVLPYAFIIPKGDPLAGELDVRKAPYFEGPEQDVLRRFRLAMEHFELSWAIRVTGDCPLISPQDLLWMANAGVTAKLDFGTNCRRAATDGQEIEFLSRRLLFHVDKEAKAVQDREHVTKMIYRDWEELEDMHRFKLYETPVQYGWQSSPKLSIDTPEDLARVNALMARTKEKPICGN